MQTEFPAPDFGRSILSIFLCVSFSTSAQLLHFFSMVSVLMVTGSSIFVKICVTFTENPMLGSTGKMGLLEIHLFFKTKWCILMKREKAKFIG